eukprot:scaffold38990_cov26-Tisochrysis_lutea.AAC.6
MCGKRARKAWRSCAGCCRAGGRRAAAHQLIRCGRRQRHASRSTLKPSASEGLQEEQLRKCAFGVQLSIGHGLIVELESFELYNKLRVCAWRGARCWSGLARAGAKLKFGVGSLIRAQHPPRA